MATIYHTHFAGDPAAGQQCRHRPDHPGALPESDRQSRPGQNLFCDWRYLPDGSPNPDFVLNQPEHQGAQILLAGDNFGCGSSREHAPWALTGWGIRAVISTSFADIFRNNALKNGLLPIVVTPETARACCSRSSRRSHGPNGRSTWKRRPFTCPPGIRFTFEVDPFSRTCLLQGVDELGYILIQSLSTRSRH